MPLYNTKDSITQVVQLLNQRLYNAGYSFRVQLVESDTVYVQASFDFGYYVNVHMEFNGCVFTNLQENDQWPDAWHADQLAWLDEYDIHFTLDWHDLDIPEAEQQTLSGIRFNINGDSVDSKGVIIFKSAVIRWEHPYYD